MTTVTPAIDRVAFPAGGLKLYRHQQDTWDARRVHGALRRIACDHRQSGKDVEALVDLLDAAIHEPGVYAYIGPTRQMVQNIAWDGVRASDGLAYTSVLPEALILERNQAELSLTIATQRAGKHSRVLFLSGNEPARLRGLPLKGVVFTEYSQFTDSEALDVILPTLNRNGGWLLIVSTPLGVGNHYHQLWRIAQDSPDWWTATRTIHDTTDHDGRPLVAPDVIDREVRNGQRLDWCQQEYECRFVVGLIASIFGDVLTKAESEGRILDLPTRLDRPTVVAYDLGINDSTVAVFVQESADYLDVVDVEAWQNMALPTILQQTQSRGYFLRDWIAPADIEQRELLATGAAGQALSRKDVAAKLGVRFAVAPKLPISDGLDAVRRMFSRFRFDSRRCAKLLEALSQYQRKWDPQMKSYADKPLHNWASDYADALRTFATGYRRSPTDHRPKGRSKIAFDLATVSSFGKRPDRAAGDGR